MEIVTINNDKQSLNNVKLGENVRIFSFVNAYGCSIDDNSKWVLLWKSKKEYLLGRIARSPAIVFM